MANASVSILAPKVQSISRRFSYAFIGVVTLILLGFAALAIFVNITRIEAELENNVENFLKLSNISLPAPLWKLDNDIVTDFIEALFLDQSLVYADVSWGGKVVAKHVRPKFQQKDFSYFKESGQFIVRTSDILYEGTKVGTLQLAVSRESVKKELMVNIAGIIALTIVIIGAIFLTSMVITRRYISRPLSTLQHSAALIAQGDLEAAIDTSSRDEIGRLAQDLSVMRDSIKQLFGALRDSNAKLEEYSRTLEQRVEERTQELTEALEQQTAISEILRAICNAPIGLQPVLEAVVENAARLCDATDAHIFRIDDDVLRLAVSFGSNPIIGAQEGIPISRDSAIGRAMVDRQTTHVHDLAVEVETEFPGSKTFQKRFGTHTMVATPLLREGPQGRDRGLRRALAPAGDWN